MAADAPVDDKLELGFQRKEMYSVPIDGTIGLFERHLFLARDEFLESDLLFAGLHRAIKERINNITFNKTLLTTCYACDAIDLSDGDVLVIPDMIKYRGLEESEIDSFVENVLVNGNDWASGSQVPGSYVFVCTGPDKRCGVCGPALIEKFNKAIDYRELKDKIFAIGCSTPEGHEYAGHLMIYSAVEGRKVNGHWYGYVAPNDVGKFIDQHIMKGEFIEKLWRGSMDNTKAEKKGNVIKKRKVAI